MRCRYILRRIHVRAAIPASKSRTEAGSGTAAPASPLAVPPFPNWFCQIARSAPFTLPSPFASPSVSPPSLTAKNSLITGQRLQIEADLREIEVDPVVRAIPVLLPTPSLHDVRSDLTRIMDALDLENIHASPEVIRTIPAILRDNDWYINVYLRGHEIVGVGPLDAQPLGYAVDLGTTKIAAYLVDLENGADLASAGIATALYIGVGLVLIFQSNKIAQKLSPYRSLVEQSEKG